MEYCNMKAIYHILTPALVLALLASCNVKMEEPVELPSATDSYTLTVTARIDKAPGTKTSIYYDADSEAYKFSWQPGDQIGVNEYIPQLNYELGYSSWKDSPVRTDISNPVDGECDKASFEVGLSDRDGIRWARENNIPLTYKYYLHSPYDAALDDYEQILAEEGYYHDLETDEWEYRACARMSFPAEQHPTADNFDPDADFMVSDLKEFDSRAVGKLDFTLTRIGSIAKIVLTDLPTDIAVSYAYVNFGYNCVNREIQYYPGNDPEDRIVTDIEYGEKEVYLVYQYEDMIFDPEAEEYIPYEADPCPVGADGTFTLWARIASGETRSIDITLYDSDGVEYVKHIEIPAESSPIVFEEGGITTFSTAPLAIDAPTLDFGDIQGYNAMILGNSITLSWQMHPNADHYECRAGDYYNKETIVPVSPVYNGGTVSVTLTPVNPVSTYYGCRWVLYVKTIAKEGHFAKDEELEYLITVSKSGDNIYYKLTPYTFSSDTYSSSGSFNYYSTDYAYSGICQSVFLDGDYEKECLATNPDGVNGESWSFTNTTPLTGIKEFMIQFTSREERDNAIGKIILLGKSAGDSEYRQLTLKTFSSAYLDCDSMKNIDYIKVISAPTPEGSEHPYYSLSIAAFDVSDLIVP